MSYPPWPEWTAEQWRAAVLQSVAKFDEGEHPRHPGGTSEGGRFADAGAGDIASDARLVKEAETGIAAIEKLLPQAIKTADFSKVPGSWDSMGEDQQEIVRQSYIEQTYHNVDDYLDTAALDKKAGKLVAKDQHESLLEKTKSRVASQHGLVPESVVFTPSVSYTSAPPLKWEDLRKKDNGAPLNEEEIKDVKETLYEAYLSAWDNAVTRFQQTEAYDHLRKLEVDEQVQQNWLKLESAEKLMLAKRAQDAGLIAANAFEAAQQAPTKWITGASEGTLEDQNYAQTNAIALKLAELRTTELMKERGLTNPKPTEKPKYVITESYNSTPQSPNYIAKSMQGKVIAASNTPEQIKINAEEWATREMGYSHVIDAKELIRHTWTTWKEKTGSGYGLAFQLASARELGGVHRMTPEEVVEAEEAAADFGGMASLQAYARAQWETTQFVMKKAGEDHIEVYRGLMLSQDTVAQSPHEILGKIPPPSNIKVVQGGKGYVTTLAHPEAMQKVTFDYNGDHLEEFRKRRAAPHFWNDATKEQQELVKNLFIEDITPKLDPNDKKLTAGQLFDMIPDKSEYLREANRSGRLNIPWETVEETVNRAVTEYATTNDLESKVLLKLPQLNLLRAGAQSTTGTAHVANEWMGVGNVPKNAVRVVLRLATPPTSVMSLPVFGVNLHEEHESVILGTKDRWVWDAWENKAPSFKDMPISHHLVRKGDQTLVIDLQDVERGQPHWLSGVQSIAKFDESQHPREAAGTSEGGQFTKSGWVKVQSEPKLAEDAKTGIAAVEKLIPEAVKTADYGETEQKASWDELSDATKELVESKWRETAYDDMDLDTSGLDDEIRKEFADDNEEILDKAFEKMEGELSAEGVERFIDTDPTLPIEGEPFHLRRVVDLDTFEYVDGDHDYATATVDLNLEALRFKSGEPLTEAEQKTVRIIWDHVYRQTFNSELEKAFESNDYMERRNDLENEAVNNEWSNLDDDAKLDLAHQYGMKTKVVTMPSEPDHWVTGAVEGKLTDEDYAQTHAIALRLTELRFDELRKERGARARAAMEGEGSEPSYTIKDTSAIHGTPTFVATDVLTGQRMGGGKTPEEAKASAEQYLETQSRLGGGLDTSTVIGGIWDAWKTKSSTGLGLSLQLAAARELGGVHRMTPQEINEAEDAAQDYGGMSTMQAYVRAQWEVTQTIMKKAGEDQISLYRGLMLEGSLLKKTDHTVISRSGVELKATNIKGLPPLGEHEPPRVSYDYGGEHFEVNLRRVETESWAEATEDTKKAVRDAMFKKWSLNPTDPSDVKQMATIFDNTTDDVKRAIMRDMRYAGAIPPEPYETPEAAVQKDVNDFTDSKYDAFVKLPKLSLLRAGAQSTTGTASVANEWSGVGHVPPDAKRVVLRVVAPPTSVLSLPVYGQNIQEEHETVLLGTKDDWLWDAWQDHAPTFEVLPVKTHFRKTLKAEPLVIDLQAEDRGKPHWLSGVKTGISFKTVLKWEESQHPRDEEGQFTRVAMTSQRGEGDPGHMSNKAVFEHMREFDAQLKALPGVSRVSVKPGVGGWEGGSESMWQVYYRGNGEAKKLVAQTAKKFNQDAVLILNKCGGKDCQPAVELSFQQAVSPTAREHVHKILVENGVGGWTWMKRDGKTLLRMVSVPQWGGEAKKHQQATIKISQQLREDGLSNKRRVHQVKVSVMEREGAHSYDAVIGS